MKKHSIDIKEKMCFILAIYKCSCFKLKWVGYKKNALGNRREEHMFLVSFSKKGKTFSIPLMLARDWINVIGIMKKKVRKK